MQFVSMIKTLLLTVLVTVSLSAVAYSQHEDKKALPTLPCPEIEVEDGNKLKSKVYAIGVQVYRWNGSSWTFVGPVANLYADANYRGQIGTHYGGPTWESNSGGKVVASRVNGCTPDPNSIAWLLLETVEAEGPGRFKDVTFIQRLNTNGGIAPSLPGVFVGEEARVPYTTEYYFYRAK